MEHSGCRLDGLMKALWQEPTLSVLEVAW